MSKDIRVKLSFFNHIKTKRLIAKHGESGAYSILRLWAYVAEFCPKGDVTHFDEVEWKASTGRDTDCIEFVNDLYQPGMNFLEKTAEGRTLIHDWQEHQTWIFYSEERSKVAKSNISKRWIKINHTTGIPPVYETDTKANTPLPLPLPLPLPNTYTQTGEGAKDENIPSGRKSKRGKKTKVPLPDNFTLSEGVKAWAQEKGFTNLEKHLEYFKDVSLAREYEYADWDAAFRTAVRCDWAKLGNSAATKQKPLTPDWKKLSK